MNSGALAVRFTVARARIDRAVEQLATMYEVSRPPPEFEAVHLKNPDLASLSELVQLAGVLEQVVAILERQHKELKDNAQQNAGAAAARRGLRVVGA